MERLKKQAIQQKNDEEFARELAMQLNSDGLIES